MPIVIIDKNEKATNPEVVKTVQKYFSKTKIINFPKYKYGNIEVGPGDINIPLDDGNLLAIERKTASDFLGSIPDRHIQSQVEVMAQHAKYSAVIITGKLSYDEYDMVKADGRLTGWHGVSVRAIRDAIQLSGCIIRDCPEDKYCQMIEEIYNTVNKPDKRYGLTQRRIVTFLPIDERVQWLAPLAGGQKLAENLLLFAENGYIDPSEDKAEYEYSSFAKALEAGTTLGRVDKEIRPELWAAKRILNFRQRLGIAGNEYIKVERDE